VTDDRTHLDLAVESYGIASALRDNGQHAWALVPLFYSAMHLVHARFDADGLGTDQRHPQHHKSYRDGDGIIVAWGTLDVVRALYPPELSKPYSKLFGASLSVRYGPSPPRGDCSSFWDLHEAVRAYTGP